ncbi:MAG: hypothetical protein ACRELA_04205 [Candidatus Rokuibacteriota bacterium]
MAAATLAIEDLPLPRRVAIAETLREVLQTERELAALYAAFAARPEPAPLRNGLDELARAKTARLPIVEALVRRLGAPPPDAPTAPRAIATERDDLFMRAFQAERSLEVAYRELLVLLGDPRRGPDLPGLAAEAGGCRDRLRHLYVRYS